MRKIPLPPVTQVGVYARVSSKRRQHPDNQLVQIREFCERRDWPIAEEYIDRESGAAGRDKRLALDKMMRDAHQGRFDQVVIFALDRLTREGIAETFDYIRRLKQSGVELCSVTEELFNTAGPSGELFIALAAWIAEQQRLRHVEQIKAGQQRARQQGKRFGAPPKQVNIERLRTLREQGKSWRAIEKLTRVPKSTARRRLAKGA